MIVVTMTRWNGGTSTYRDKTLDAALRKMVRALSHEFMRGESFTMSIVNESPDYPIVDAEVRITERRDTILL